MSKPVMYIFINKGLGMSSGKIAAQASHAAVEAYKVSKPKLIAKWYDGLHYTKLVMQARNEQHLTTIQQYLEDRGFHSVRIVDEGMTEIDAHQITALGVEIVDKEDSHTEATFSTFELYRDRYRVVLEVND
jgi:peptidyl-tRNA hydrolase